jgi:proteasome lid subunit RPN8/RPN11
VQVTTATIERIHKELTAARARGDRAEITRLFFSLPLTERSQPVVRPGGSTRLQGATYPRSDTASAPATGWPTIFAHPAVLSRLRNVEFSGHEEAGFLVGTEADGELEILSFFDAHNPDTATWRTVEIDLERGLLELMRLPHGQELVGEYHLHPDGAGSNASSQDLAAGAAMAKSFHRSHWVSLITSEPDSRWAIYSTVGAYVIRPDGNHRVVEIAESRS